MIKNKKNISIILFLLFLLFPIKVFAETTANTTSNEEYTIVFRPTVDKKLVDTDCYVEIENQDNGKRYSFPLYKHNDYENRVTVDSAGKYIIVAGGVMNDYSGNKVAESVEFNVTGSYAIYVDFKIGNPNNFNSNTSEEVSTTTINENNTTNNKEKKDTAEIDKILDDSNKENTESKNNDSMSKKMKIIFYTTFSMITITILVFVVLIIRRNRI